jgi:hypothetical protein
MLDVPPEWVVKASPLIVQTSTDLRPVSAVNKLLGHDDRVAMTNRPGHDPTAESNEQIYRFLEHVLKPGDRDDNR